MAWNIGKPMSSKDSSDDSDNSYSLLEPTRTVRMKEKEYYLVTNTSRDGTSRTMPDCEGASGSTRLLRPAKASSSDLVKDMTSHDTDGMRLIDNKKWWKHGIQHMKFMREMPQSVLCRIRK